MDLAWIWKSALLILVGMVLLRIAGRKSISQMTVATTVIMISIGTTIVQPIAEKSLWKAIGCASVFIVSLLIIEALELKFDWFERLMSGNSVIVIEDGNIVEKNLTLLRLTVDQLETRLRQQGISQISDVKTASMGPNGLIGYELMRHAKPVTIGELERMLGLKSEEHSEQGKLFQEISRNGHTVPVDPRLQ